MLQICPKLPNQKFEEPPFEVDIHTFLRDLGHSGEIKMLTDVNVNKLHQPWRSFTAVINKCLSGKGLFLSNRDQECQEGHEDTQLYGAMLPDELTNDTIKDSNSYKENYAIALGAEPPKTKVRPKKKQAESNITSETKTSTASKGKRIKTSAKVSESAKKEKPVKKSKAKGLSVLFEVALTEVEQMKLATRRSLIETHSSHASGFGTDEGTGVKPGVFDVLKYDSEDDLISRKSSDEGDDDDVMSDDEDEDEDDDDREKDDEAEDDKSDDDDQDNDDDELSKLDNDDDAQEEDDVNESDHDKDEADDDDSASSEYSKEDNPASNMDTQDKEHDKENQSDKENVDP
ncbi:hypothetical protein Tco_0888144 [Tanacetum coccineum]